MIEILGTEAEEQNPTLTDGMADDARSFTARELAAAGERVVVLSGDPALAEKSALPLRKLWWNPYPGWIRRWFNFNDWTRFPVQNKNVYEVRLPAAERPDGTVRSAPEGFGAAG